MKTISLKILVIYKRIFSSVFDLFFGRGCRYSPTCSEYAKKSIERFGVFRGSKLTFKRISRCHPFYSGDYFDPVPIKL
jgi:putative membrane protein insertion efficiency factor